MKPIDSIMTGVNVLVIKNYKCWIIFVFYFTFFCMMPIRIAHGTTVVAIRNTDGIFIGADSKEVGELEPICKVMQVNNIFFGFAGHIVIFRPSFVTFKFFSMEEIEIFNVHEIATKVGTIEGTIRDKINYFDKLIKADLENALNIWHRTVSKDEFRSTFGDKYPLLVVIAGIENGIPILFEKHYSIDNSDATPLRIKIDTYQPTSNHAFVCIGTCDAIVQDIRQNETTANLDPIKMIKRWITLQASADSSGVGLPIDILRIAPSIVEWIQYKPQCPEIKTEFLKNRRDKQ